MDQSSIDFAAAAAAAAPAPRDLSHHYSYVTRNRQASNVKRLYQYMTPGVANLAGGMPHVSYFPFDNLKASVALPERFEPSHYNGNHDEEVTKASNRDHPASAKITVPKETSTPSPANKIDLSSALQYGTAQGYPPLFSFLRQFTRENLHPNVPYAAGPEIILTCGSTDGFAKAIEAFSNPWNPERDWTRHREGILCEEFTYMNAIQTVKPRGMNVVPVPIDADGMIPSGLRDVLENWDFRRGKRPHLMYTITMGQNPTGATIPVSRRKEIYALCQEYDILIIEDDPYWNLQYPSAYDATARSQSANTNVKSSGYAFLDSLVPSYLSIDIDGRVIRLDTFSKTIAPGCRLGWITAQPAFIERFMRITEVSTQQPSGFVQSLVAELLLGPQMNETVSENATARPPSLWNMFTEKERKDASPSIAASQFSWKIDGWVRWLEGLRGGYERRMQTMCSVLEQGKHVVLDNDDDNKSSSGSNNVENNINTHDVADWQLIHKVQMYDFIRPTAGMFIWLKLHLDTHPLLHRHEHGKKKEKQYSPQQLSKALWVHLAQKPHQCLVAPGEVFAPTEQLQQSAAWRYHRLCFAPMEAEDVAGQSRRLVEGYRSFWQRRDLDGLLDDVDVDVHDHEGGGGGGAVEEEMLGAAEALRF